MRSATLLPVLALVWATSCSRCGPPRPVLDVAAPEEDAAPEAPEPRDEEHRLPKHDWNGLTVMMREAEARAALEAVGFTLVPSRHETFPILDQEAHTITLVPVQGYTPPLVIMETEKSESPLERSTGEYRRALDPSIPVREDKPGRGTPAAIEPPSIVPPSEVPAFAAQRSPGDGPSEFTRLVSGGAAQPDTPAKSAAPEYDEEPAPRGATPSLRVLVIGLSAIVVAIVVLIILFAVL